MKRKNRRRKPSFRDLQTELGHLQTENEDLRNQVQKLSLMIHNITQEYQEKMTAMQAERDRLQQLLSAGIKLPSDGKAGVDPESNAAWIESLKRGPGRIA